MVLVSVSSSPSSSASDALGSTAQSFLAEPTAFRRAYSCRAAAVWFDEVANGATAATRCTCPHPPTIHARRHARWLLPRLRARERRDRRVSRVRKQNARRSGTRSRTTHNIHSLMQRPWWWWWAVKSRVFSVKRRRGARITHSIWSWCLRVRDML